MKNKKILKEARTIFNNLETYPNSVLFSEERIDQRLSKKLKKSKCLKDSQLLKLIILADTKDFLDDDKTSTRADYVEKRELTGLPTTVLMDLFSCFAQRWVT